jgi:hypothetical protein
MRPLRLPRLLVFSSLIVLGADGLRQGPGYADEPPRPRVTPKADAKRPAAEAQAGWFAFEPGPDAFSPANAIDLRGLNEPSAGDGGPIAVRGGQFVHKTTGQPIRFWGVNITRREDSIETLRLMARGLAKRGVNLVRIHHGYFDQNGDVDMKVVRQAIDVVEAMKAQGIYCHFSIYFLAELSPKPNTPWLKGYNGGTHPFAALFFNADFQEKYRSWWKALLLTPSITTGKRLVDEPAVAGLEIINEDSYLFYTFAEQNIPDAQLRLLEAQFGTWLARRHGSLDKAIKSWGGSAATLKRDDPAGGRMAFRPLWNMAHEKTARDKDTVRFLVEGQRGFYRAQYEFLRGLGFQGVITASNWTTADQEVLGPLEKYSYTACDFLDRHGYIGCHRQGGDLWSIREGHTYADRSALRFDPEEPGKARSFVHPAMDPSYDGRPSMISETTYERPNRYRSEAPLFYAAYGALQDSDAIVHFTYDAASWSVKPNFFMQPWTLSSPAMMGQFPAAALIYRQGLVADGELLVDLDLSTSDLFDLKGTPMPQDAAFDDLRARDVPRGTTLEAGRVIDPLVHFAGRTNVNFIERGKGGTVSRLRDLGPYIDRKRQVVTSSTGQLRLDYGRGLLAIDAPAAQAASGALRAAGPVELKDMTVISGLELGHVAAVSLDGRPLATSRKILLQAMSEEMNSDFATEPAGAGDRRITRLGRDPWLVRDIDARVKFKRPDAAQLKVTALDANGEPVKERNGAAEFRLDPQTLYYLITP